MIKKAELNLKSVRPSITTRFDSFDRETHTYFRLRTYLPYSIRTIVYKLSEVRCNLFKFDLEQFPCLILSHEGSNFWDVK
jgi:hypothetical protein